MADCEGTFVDFAWRRAINFTGTAIRASEKDPVLVSGFQYTVTSEGLLGETVKEIWFAITCVMDMRGLPGFEQGEPPTGADDPDLQIPYHEGGMSDFKLDSGPCE